MPSVLVKQTTTAAAATQLVTHKLPSLHAGWLLCCFILSLIIPFSLVICPRFRQILGAPERVSAALQEAPDN